MTVNPLVAGRLGGEPSPWAGVWIAEDIELIAHGVRTNSWVDTSLGTVSAGLDGLALVVDPIGSLLQYGAAWMLEHVRPLSEALDWLAGDPGQIDAHARTWRNAAGALTTEADALVKAVRWDLDEWFGPAATAYAGWADAREQTLRTLARGSECMAAMVEGAGALVATVRALVRDAIAVVVSRLITYAGELFFTAGIAAPAVVAQVSALCASWGARIARWLRALIHSLGRLGEAMRRLADLLGELRRLSPTSTSGGSSGVPRSPDARPPFRASEPGTPEFRERLNELAADPAHGGVVKRKGLREAEVALDLERRGVLPGPVRRSPLDVSDPANPRDQGDFIDGNDVIWDVKAPKDVFPLGPNAGQPMPDTVRGRYDGALFEGDLATELGKGQNVILDTEHLSEAALADLRQRVESHPEWRDRVRFH